MNGWQRLGVIASAAWFIGMWIYAGDAQERKRDADWQFHYRICRDLPHDLGKDFEQSNQCGEEAERYADVFCCGGTSAVWDSSKQSWITWFVWRHQNQIAAALFPIPLFWLAAYICVWLARWVKRGFEREQT